MPQYTSDLLAELATQLRYSPQRVRREHLDRIEQLIPQIDPSRSYPYEYVCFRITRFRPESHIQEPIPGHALRGDLLKVLLEISGPVAVRVTDVDEPVLSLAEARERLAVSNRTLHRWRREGLLSRKFIFPDGRRRPGIRLSALEQFVAGRGERSGRPGACSLLTPTERAEIVTIAHRLRREEGLTLSASARRIAALTHRSPQTIRSVLRHYDRRNPRESIFPGSRRPLTDEEQRAVFRRHEQGETIAGLCREFRRSRSSLYAVIRRQRLADLLTTPADYMPSPEFDAPNADEKILGTIPGNPPLAIPQPTRQTGPRSAPPYLRELYRTALLTPEQERDLFRKYNYVKFKMARLQAELRAHGYRAPAAVKFKRLRENGRLLRKALVRANLRLVVSIAKRHVGKLVGLFELVSEGNVVLMRTVERFDYLRGTRFATYATWAIIKHYARTVPEANYRLSTFVTGQDALLQSTGDAHVDAVGRTEAIAHMKKLISGALTPLTDRERHVIHSRFGLGGQTEPKTLQEIGTAFGLTRERIRQIERGALDKMRQWLGPDAAEAFA